LKIFEQVRIEKGRAGIKKDEPGLPDMHPVFMQGKAQPCLNAGAFPLWK
jgi:hypothetical protein